MKLSCACTTVTPNPVNINQLSKALAVSGRRGKPYKTLIISVVSVTI